MNKLYKINEAEIAKKNKNIIRTLWGWKDQSNIENLHWIVLSLISWIKTTTTSSLTTTLRPSEDLDWSQKAYRIASDCINKY